MAIINITPDSFSDGGNYANIDAAVAHAVSCVRDGAAILDIGGESTRPGAAEVTAAEEQDRVLPVIEKLAAETDALISIDTYRAETARLAMAAGAHIINDVHGLQREPEIATVAAQTSAGVCIMHTGRGREQEKRPDRIADQEFFLRQSLEIARSAGISDEAIVLDPGFGFAKDRDDDMELMARFAELHRLGFPLLAGTSRKRFVGALLGGAPVEERLHGTMATVAAAILRGASIVRVHDVRAAVDTVRVADTIKAVTRKP